MKKSIGIALSIALGTLALAPSAQAETVKKANAYEYKFEDDGLLGVNGGPAGTNITVLKLGRRDRLLRPRLSFVPEMLKSVENM